MSAQAPTSSSGLARVVVDDLEGVLDPDVVTVAMAEAVLDASTTPSDQRLHLTEGARRIVGMEMIRPAFGIGGHLLGRIAHDPTEILAHEGAGVIARGLGGVDDRGTDGEKVLETLTRALQLGGNRPALGLEGFQVFDALAELDQLVQELFLGLLVIVKEGFGSRSGRHACRVLFGSTRPAPSFVHDCASSEAQRNAGDGPAWRSLARINSFAAATTVLFRGEVLACLAQEHEYPAKAFGRRGRGFAERA